MSAAEPAFDAAAIRGLGIKPLASLLAHRRLALIVLVLAFVVAAPIAWIKGQPRYVATATVQVTPRYMKNVKDDNELDFQSNSQYRHFVEHQARSVGRYDILSAAIEAAAARGYAWRRGGESARRAVERLQEQLVVVPVADTYLMQISLAGGGKEGLAELVNAVVAVYIETMKDELVFGADERMKAVLAREAELLRAIREAADRRTAIALEIGVSTFNEQEGNPHDQLLLAARTALEEAQRSRIAAEAKLRAFEANRETDLVTRSIQETVLNDPGLNSLKSSLNTRRAALATAASGLTADHPAHEAAQGELAEIEAEIAKRSGQLTRDVAGNIRARYLSTVDQSRRYEKEMASILGEREARSAQAAKLYNEALSLDADIEAARKELDAVRARLNFFSGERQALGYGIGRKKLLLAALLAALLLAAIAPTVIDLVDSRVRAVGDAERAMNMPALGWHVEGDGEAARLFADDQLRRMAGALTRERDRHGTQVFALSGVKPGAGTSRLALRLGRTLDRLGYPTLVVEANAFSPDARYGGARPGLADCLREEAAADQCIEPALGELPARVRVGTTVDGHLGRIDRLRGLLDGWRQQHAFVLVDAAPLLLAADAEIVLDRIGHALLVVEADATTRGEIARARRVLEASAAQAAGLIVNRVRVLEGGGYLRHLLVEFLTRRKYAEFASLPAWRLQLATWIARGNPLRRLEPKGVSA
jgi:Mrp family chromosome partitioning ATPase